MCRQVHLRNHLRILSHTVIIISNNVCSRNFPVWLYRGKSETVSMHTVGYMTSTDWQMYLLISQPSLISFSSLKGLVRLRIPPVNTQITSRVAFESILFILSLIRGKNRLDFFSNQICYVYKRIPDRRAGPETATHSVLM